MEITKKLIQEKTKEAIFSKFKALKEIYLDLLEEILSSARLGNIDYRYFNDDPYIFYSLRRLLRMDGFRVDTYDQDLTSKFMVISWEE